MIIIKNLIKNIIILLVSIALSYVLSYILLAALTLVIPASEENTISESNISESDWEEIDNTLYMVPFLVYSTFIIISTIKDTSRDMVNIE